MNAFTIVCGGLLAFFVIATLLLGVFSKRSALEILDWKPTRSAELEAENEIDDVAQMIEAQNELRRRRGQAGAHAGGGRAAAHARPGGPARVPRALVARVLIVPCGCRGRALARGAARRRATRCAGRRATPRTPRRSREAGAEPYIGDPDRIGTLMEALPA